MTNLIPMAGAGSRFAVEGYALPKPLIPVSGKPMVVQAALSLPPSEQWVFICREEHVQDSKVVDVLNEHFPANRIVTVEHLTEGQASTCLLSEPYIGKNEPLVVGACDNGMTWNREKYQNLIEQENVDALIWTFRKNPTVKHNPQMYGWVVVDEDNRARQVSCKVPISQNPISDHAIIGTFYFKKAAYLFDAARQMVAKNRRINNEFYVDEAMNELIERGLHVKVFEVEKYLCWGTPNDLKTYEYWERYFSRLIK